MSDIFVKMFSCMNGYAMVLIFVLFFVGMFTYLKKIECQRKAAHELKGKFKIDNLFVSKAGLKTYRGKAAEVEAICNNIYKRMIGVMWAGIILYTATLAFRIIGGYNGGSSEFIYTFSFCVMLIGMIALACAMMVSKRESDDSLRILNVELGSVSKKYMQGYIKLLEDEIESMNNHLRLLENDEREPTMLEAYDMIEGISLVNRAITVELQKQKEVAIKG